MQHSLPRAVFILDVCNVWDFKFVLQVCVNDKPNRRSESRQKVRLEKSLEFGQNAREINPQFNPSPFDCTFNIVGSCCVRSYVAKSLTGFKYCATTPNKTQQGAQTDKTCNIQQCCVRLYKAFGLRNPFNNKVKFQKPGQASLSLKWPHGYTKRALSRSSLLLSFERRSNKGATAIENGKKAIGFGPVKMMEVQPPSTVNFSQRLYEKKVQPSVRARAYNKAR